MDYAKVRRTEEGDREREQEIGSDKTQLQQATKRHRAADEKQKTAIGGKVCATTL